MRPYFLVIMVAFFGRMVFYLNWKVGWVFKRLIREEIFKLSALRLEISRFYYQREDRTFPIIIYLIYSTILIILR